jgi:hypothetical protein
MSNFVPLSELRSADAMKRDPFFAKMVARNTLPSGEDASPGLYRRLQNPDCVACQATYKKKYPDRAFQPNCQGIHDEIDYAAYADGTGMSMLEAAEFLDVETWMESYIVISDEDGNYHPYSAETRPFQRPVLKCTAQYQVDRMGRGMGKTTLAIGTELHKAYNNKNYKILVLCPAKAQAQLWYEEINKQFENSPMLKGALKRSIQAPYFMFKLYNGATISIFTAGSKAGRGAVAIRGQSPHRVRLDEQDYLAEADYDAVMALLRRFAYSEFHGSSTPTGARSMYWQMCTQLPEYKEFYIPVTMKLNWGPEEEATLRKEAKTEDRYNHEYMALFGDLEQGVFKGLTVDNAKKHYDYAQVVYTPDEMEVKTINWNDCAYNPAMGYVLGCDWNGKGTGTRIRITEFNHTTKVRRCVYKETIDSETSTTTISLTHIKLLNRVFHCDYIYCDKGFGFAQDELLRKMGVNPPLEFRENDIKLLRAKFVGSKENLKTNALVPKRDPNSPYLADSELERQTKPFMVEGCQIAMEQLKVVFSSEDERLEAQMRDFRVKTYSANGQAQSYEAKTEGDHDLDAWILSMLGIELAWGLFFDAAAHHRLAQLATVSSFGTGLAGKIAAARARMMQTATPSRVSEPDKEDEWNTVFAGRDSALVAPAKTHAGAASGLRSGGGGFSRGSRTAAFRTKKTGRSQSYDLGRNGPMSFVSPRGGGRRGL